MVLRDCPNDAFDLQTNAIVADRGQKNAVAMMAAKLRTESGYKRVLLEPAGQKFVADFDRGETTASPAAFAVDDFPVRRPARIGHKNRFTGMKHGPGSEFHQERGAVRK